MIVSLQYLRALAAMMVVAFHASEYVSRITGTPPAFPFTAGLSGVDIFFVISGFIIFRTTDGRAVGPMAFLWKRIIRVVPLYWLLTLLVANVAIVRPDLLSTTVYDGGHLLASLFFVPATHPLLGGAVPMLIPGWTLNYEMAFYALFALSLALPRPARLPLVLGVLVAAVAARHVVPMSVAGIFYTMPLILEFGAGILIAKAYGSTLAVRRSVAAAAFMLGCAALLAMAGSGLWRSLASGIPAAFIVAGAVFWERGGGMRMRRVPLLLGNASYSIYLTHVLTMPVLAKTWAAAGIANHPAANGLFILLAMLTSAAAGVAVHALVERPLLRLMRGGRRLRNAEDVTDPKAGAPPSSMAPQGCRAALTTPVRPAPSPSRG